MAIVDPDYNVGIKYNGISYKMKFGDYIKWYIDLAKELHRVLKDDGNMFFINYPKHNSHLRVRYLDDACHSVNEYVWFYNIHAGSSSKKFTTAHRSILLCTKSENNKWDNDAVAVDYICKIDKRIKKKIDMGSPGKTPYSWFYYDIVNNVSREKTIHPCQLPSVLIEKLIKVSTKLGDVVLVPFAGAGSEVLVAKRLGRRFIAAEVEELYVKVIMERLKKVDF
ncbi:DNA-methyltransferase [Candidatus Magnetomonas plexicatena]|uniref:DNA-methyltransferase n=1 Tax=Candidatus Magnetomonas plexicatena TaxID=2552947 RepID=UPI0011037D05|nr:site-specific DNA-methyltransferase [Nitrospirales bacterium LBB_01]